MNIQQASPYAYQYTYNKSVPTIPNQSIQASCHQGYYYNIPQHNLYQYNTSQPQYNYSNIPPNALEAPEPQADQNSYIANKSYYTNYLNSSYLQENPQENSFLKTISSFIFDNKEFSNANQMHAFILKNQGIKYFNKRMHSEALACYNKSFELVKGNIKERDDLLYNMAKVYEQEYETTKNTTNLTFAVQCIQALLNDQPNDLESRVYLGTLYEQMGFETLAVKEYRKALNVDPSYDYAKRHLDAIEKRGLITNDMKQQKLREAIQWINFKAPTPLVNLTNQALKNVSIEFGYTQEENGYKTNAYYDHNNKKIVISNELMYSHPLTIAAFLIHEVVHAADNDSNSSIAEEQDAFLASAQFLSNLNPSDIPKDPEIKSIMKYYKDPENPFALQMAVEKAYLERSIDMPLESMNHNINPEYNKYIHYKYFKLMKTLERNN